MALVVRWTTRAILYVGGYWLLGEIVSRPAFPRVGAVASAVGTVMTGEFMVNFGVTLWRWAAVFALGTLTGVVGGIAVGASRSAHRALSFEIDFFRSLPATLLVTFVLAAFGDGELQRSLPALYITFFTVLFYVAKHISILDRRRVEHLRELGARWPFILRNCLFYELLPAIMVAARQAISLSFLVAVSIELIVGSYRNWGLGRVFYDWQFYLKYSEIVAGLLILGFVGYVLNVGMRYLHWKAIPWRPPPD